MLGGGVSPEEIGVYHIDVASFIKRLSNLVDQVLTQDVIVDGDAWWRSFSIRNWGLPD